MLMPLSYRQIGPWSPALQLGGVLIPRDLSKAVTKVFQEDHACTVCHTSQWPCTAWGESMGVQTDMPLSTFLS